MAEDRTHVRYMDLGEFQRLGFLQEINRRFLHPCGLALEIRRDGDGGPWRLAGVWDYRGDPEGILYRAEDLAGPDARRNVEAVNAEIRRHAAARHQAAGGVVQPVPGAPTPLLVPVVRFTGASDTPSAPAGGAAPGAGDTRKTVKRKAAHDDGDTPTDLAGPVPEATLGEHGGGRDQADRDPDLGHGLPGTPGDRRAPAGG